MNSAIFRIIPPAFAVLSLVPILAGGSSAAAQSDGNLIANPYLRDGILAPKGWGLHAAAGNRAVWQVSATTGRHAVLLDGSGRDWAGLSSRRVRARPGETFTVAAWLRAVAPARATNVDRLFVRFFRRGKFLGQKGPGLGALTPQWQVVSGTVSSPGGTDTVDVSVQIRSEAGVQIAAVFLSRGDHAGRIPRLERAPDGPDDWQTVAEPQNLPLDADRNGLPDELEAFLGIRPEDRAVSSRRTRTGTTSLQTPTGYRDDNDLKVDAVIVAGNQEHKIRSWAALGYEPHVMVGFRAGPAYLDGREDGVNHRDEVQTDSRGALLTCGPGSHYMVPTENRRRVFRQYFADAVHRGAKAVCPEEPEFFSRAGYSDAFKREWRTFYGEPWQDQASSVAARFKSDRLKAHLERRLLEACYQGARGADPSVPRFLLTHSPLNYTGWGIVFGHHDLIATGQVDAVVAQVWTGTARTPVRYEGKRRERTFENGFLEYASCLGLTRGLDLDLWFLMDPLEDNPDRSMADYHGNYLRTLAAALMFPEVTRFETMPWPTRIFGRVPDDFATEICSVINVLSDMQNQRAIEWDCGTRGVGTFLSDSAMWQRGEPHVGDLDCFYGLALPLLMHGIPVEVPHLDRAADPGYLDRYRVLLVSYDMLKPMNPRINDALAAWAERGGSLVVCGGDDPYNAVPEWWSRQGFDAPQDHLLSRCGFDVSRRQVLRAAGRDVKWTVVARTDYTGRNLENQETLTIDLSPFLRDGIALIKCEDSLKSDGWGALITKLTARGIRGGRKTTLEVRPDTPAERALVFADSGSKVNPAGFRFCDASTHVVYRLGFDPGSKATLEIEIGNQYVVSATTGSTPMDRTFSALAAPYPLGQRSLRPAPSETIVMYDRSGADPLYVGAAGGLLSEKKVGRGTVIFFGCSPSRFAQSAEACAQLRALVRHAVERNGSATYREQAYLKLKRGRYTIAKTFDEGLVIPGTYVNVLHARLPVVLDVRLGPDQVAVLYDASPALDSNLPGVLFSSSCVEWVSTQPERLRMIVSGASGVYGTCRIHTAGRKPSKIRAVAVAGHEVHPRTEHDGHTMLLCYPDEPFGLAIDIAWRTD